jgi:hypothetical protein
MLYTPGPLWFRRIHRLLAGMGLADANTVARNLEASVQKGYARRSPARKGAKRFYELIDRIATLQYVLQVPGIFSSPEPKMPQGLYPSSGMDQPVITATKKGLRLTELVQSEKGIRRVDLGPAEPIQLAQHRAKLKEIYSS